MGGDGDRGSGELNSRTYIYNSGAQFWHLLCPHSHWPFHRTAPWLDKISIMPNWSDPKEIARDAAHIFAFRSVCMGTFYDLRFRVVVDHWSPEIPLASVFFFFCRYCILFALIGLIISLTVTTRINCGALYTFNSFNGNMTILCASTSLMLRTIALWERRRSVIVILGTICLAHWALLYRTMFIVKAAWDEQSGVCAVIATNPSILNTTFFFTMGFDLVILGFTAVALLAKHSARTDLWKLLFQDGLIYFLVSFSTNSIPAVLNVVNLNSTFPANDFTLALG
ncbi:hypothetical protein BD779DRAFT_366364 [Infundibulicybe gibba]|nr:hypothetical protein BD779DRAFT_366364 [Infundibulicybe gibba]